MEREVCHVGVQVRVGANRESRQVLADRGNVQWSKGIQHIWRLSTVQKVVTYCCIELLYEQLHGIKGSAIMMSARQNHVQGLFTGDE